MQDWHFTLVLNRGMTEEEADAVDNLDEPLFADGSVSYTMDGPGPSTLMCAVQAPTLLEAVAEAASAIRRIPGLRAVAAEAEDLLTLKEAAERLPGRLPPLDLATLAREHTGEKGFPAPEGETDGEPFYSWRKIAASLRALGHEVPETPRDLELADLALRTAYQLDAARVPVGIRQALGLTSAP